MNPKRRMSRTDLFLLRIWAETPLDAQPDADNGSTWRGKIQRISNGESHEFQTWDALVKTLRSMVSSDLLRTNNNAEAPHDPGLTVEGEET